MAGSVDLYAGNRPIGGQNVFSANKNPLNTMDEGVTDAIGTQASGIGTQISNEMQALILAIIGGEAGNTAASTADLSNFFDDVLGFLGNGSADSMVTGTLVPTQWFQDLLALLGFPSGLGTGTTAGGSISDLENEFQALIDGVTNTIDGDITDLITYITTLETDFSEAITTGDWDPLLIALFGSTTFTDVSQVLQSSIDGLTDLWDWLFGIPNPGSGSTIDTSKITGVTEVIYPAPAGRGVLKATAKANRFVVPVTAPGRGVLAGTVNFVKEEPTLYGQAPDLFGRGVLAATAFATKFSATVHLTGQGVLSPKVPETLTIFPTVGTVYTPTVYPVASGHGVLTALAHSSQFRVAGPTGGRGLMTAIAPESSAGSITGGIDTLYPQLSGRGVLTAGTPHSIKFTLAGRTAGNGALFGQVPELITTSFVLGVKNYLTVDLFGSGTLKAAASVKQFALPGVVAGRGVLSARVPDITTSSFVTGQKFGIQSFPVGRGVLKATANSTRAIVTAALPGHGALTSRSGGPSIGQLEQSLMNALWLALTGGGTGTIAELGSAFADLMTLLGWTSSTNLGTGSPVAPAITAVPILGTLVSGTNPTVANDIFGGSTFWSSLMSLLFPSSGGSVGTAVVPTAVSNVLGNASLGDDLTALATSLFGAPAVATLTTIENDIANFIGNAISGGSAPTSTNSPVGFLGNTLSAIPHTNVVIPPNPGTGSITHDATAHATPFSGGSPTVSKTLSWNHTCSSTADYLIVRVGYYASIGNYASVTYGGMAMQQLTAVLAPDSLTGVQIYALPNPAAGTASVSVMIQAPFGVIRMAAAASDSYVGVAGVGTIATHTGANSSPSMTIASATNNMLVNAFYLSSNTVNSETLASYNQTSQYNSGNLEDPNLDSSVLLAGDAAGASSVTFSATAFSTTQDDWAGAAVNLIPLTSGTIGSGFRAFSTVTTAINGAGGNNTFANNFFNNSSQTADMSYSTTGNTLTVNQAGWYKVVLHVLEASTGVPHFVRPVLYHNAGVAKTGPVLNVTTTNANTWTFGMSGNIYCSAGDTLQPGYWMSSSGVTSIFVGEATGTFTYFEVALANRSLF